MFEKDAGKRKIHDINRIKVDQHCAARFVKNSFNRAANATVMLKSWPTLAQRRNQNHVL